MVTIEPSLSWLPSDLDAVPCGQWWDAIAVPQIRGLRILDHLGRMATCPLGPVIWNPAPKVASLYYLVPRGAAAAWDAPGSSGLGAGSSIEVPGWERVGAPGTHWVAVPDLSRRGTLCDVAELRAALLRADGAAA